MRKKSQPNKRRKKSDTNINCPTPQNPTEDLGASSPSTGRKRKKLRSSDTAVQSCSTEVLSLCPLYIPSYLLQMFREREKCDGESVGDVDVDVDVDGNENGDVDLYMYVCM